MKSVKFLLPTLLLLSFASSQFVLANPDAAQGATPAIKQIASILVDLNHHPDASGKAALQAIMNDTSASEAERTLATAIANLDHKASDGDRAKLQAVVSDNKTPAAARDIANIVLNLSHKPSPADKQTLKNIMQ